GQHVRFTAKLIRPGTDRYLWARSYERELGDVVVLQGETARAIAAAIEGGVASPSQLRPTRRPVNPEAYDLYLQGIYAEGRVTYEGFRGAIGFFERAVAKQPDFAAAHEEIATAYMSFLWTGPLWPEQVVPKVEAAAHRALELDGSLWKPHEKLAFTRRLYGDNAEADKQTRQAEERKPRLAEWGGLLQTQLVRAGRFEEAVLA